MSNFDELLKQSKEMSKNLDLSIKEFENIISADYSHLPEEQKKSMEDAKRITSQALEMAKKGDVSGINNLINSFKDGSKNNKA